MTLPTSVQVVLASEDPVPSTLLNALQECVVGDLHPSRSLVLGPAAWQTKSYGRGAGGTAAQLGDSQWVWGGSAPCLLVADVGSLVPVGHEITAITWLYTRGGAGSVTRSVYTRNLATGAAEVQLVAPTADGAGGAWAGATNSLSYVVPASTAITLEVALANAAHVFGGAVVAYRKLP